MIYSPTEIIGQVWDGMITVDEACRLLDDQKIRGGFGDDGFLGYDYSAQRWLKILWPNL
jgi:hypothetical protein